MELGRLALGYLLSCLVAASNSSLSTFFFFFFLQEFKGEASNSTSRSYYLSMPSRFFYLLPPEMSQCLALMFYAEASVPILFICSCNLIMYSGCVICGASLCSFSRIFAYAVVWLTL